MAIAFQNATTVVVAAANNGNATITVPSGTSDGDFLLVGFCYEQATSPASPFMSAAWNLITQVDGVPTPDQDIWTLAWWRRASSEPASYDITTNGTYGDSSAAFMLRYTGVISSGDPIRVSATAIAQTSPQDGPDLVGLESTDLAVQICGINYVSWDPPPGNIVLSGPGGGWTQRANQANDTSDSKTGIAVLEQFNQGTGPTWSATSSVSTPGFAMIGFGLVEESAEILNAHSTIVNQQAIRRSSLW